MGVMICPIAERIIIIGDKQHKDYCPIYKNWVKQKDKGLDVICRDSKGKYFCLALDAIYDAETGVDTDEKLKERLGSNSGCPIIDSCNNQADIQSRLASLVRSKP